MGKLETGKVTKGKKLVLMPNKKNCKVAQIWFEDNEVKSAIAGQNLKVCVWKLFWSLKMTFLNLNLTSFNIDRNLTSADFFKEFWLKRPWMTSKLKFSKSWHYVSHLKASFWRIIRQLFTKIKTWPFTGFFDLIWPLMASKMIFWDLTSRASFWNKI